MNDKYEVVLVKKWPNVEAMNDEINAKIAEVFGVPRRLMEPVRFMGFEFYSTAREEDL